MTRVTAPLSKLARPLAANPTMSRPAYLACIHSSSNGASPARPELSDREDASRHFTTSHRPMPVPSRNRVVPLMQTFTTTVPSAARLDTSSIDYAVMPDLSQPTIAPWTIRVPLLPDNYSTDRASHAPEATDGAAGAPLVSVVAAHPDLVTPASPLTAVEGINIDGVELKFGHSDAAPADGEDNEPGMLHDIWKGIVEDVFGEKKATH